jgi:hypothetical protein
MKLQLAELHNLRRFVHLGGTQEVYHRFPSLIFTKRRVHRESGVVMYSRRIDEDEWHKVGNMKRPVS